MPAEILIDTWILYMFSVSGMCTCCIMSSELGLVLMWWQSPYVRNTVPVMRLIFKFPRLSQQECKGLECCHHMYSAASKDIVTKAQVIISLQIICLTQAIIDTGLNSMLGIQLALVINIQPCMQHSRSPYKMSSTLRKINMKCPIYVTARFNIDVDKCM